MRTSFFTPLACSWRSMSHLMVCNTCQLETVARACRNMEDSREETFEACWILHVSVNQHKPSREKEKGATFTSLFGLPE